MIEAIEKALTRAMRVGVLLTATYAVGGSAVASASAQTAVPRLPAAVDCPPTIAFAAFEGASPTTRKRDFDSVSRGHLVFTQRELGLCINILKTFEDDAVLWRGDYFETLDSLLDQLAQILVDTSDVAVTATSCRSIAHQLEAARLSLLETAPVLRDWRLLAQAMELSSLETPTRFAPKVLDFESYEPPLPPHTFRKVRAQTITLPVPDWDD